MLAPELAPGDWDVLVSPWHLNEKIEAFPGIGGAASITRPSYPGSSELSSLVDRCRDIADAAGGSDRPLLLSGDCLAALGMVTGLQRRCSDLTVVWLDAHGDFNNPAISTSGYLAGMSLAMVTGRASEVISGPLGLRPVPDERALLIGARDLDDAERDALKVSRVRRAVPDPAAVRAALEHAQPSSVYIHLDIDIVDGNDLPATLRWETSAGPSIAAVEDCLAHIVDYSQPVGASMACPWPASESVSPRLRRRLAASPERWALFSNSSTVHLAAARAASSGPGLISC
jgi:arginase